MGVEYFDRGFLGREPRRESRRAGVLWRRQAIRCLVLGKRMPHVAVAEPGERVRYLGNEDAVDADAQ